MRFSGPSYFADGILFTTPYGSMEPQGSTTAARSSGDSHAFLLIPETDPIGNSDKGTLGDGAGDMVSGDFDGATVTVGNGAGDVVDVTTGFGSTTID
jgi:hypothetical protein